MNAEQACDRLQAPFDPSEVKWKPQSVKGNRALAIAYVDARVVMDRLDDVFGVGGWQTAYSVVQDGVVCKLRVKVASEWIEHHDVGSFSEQPDDGDKLKAAFSDSLKRAAVHIGIGRYLYRLPHQWCDYDPQGRKFAKQPTLPDWAKPKPQNQTPPPPAKPAAPPKPNGSEMPKTGEELEARLASFSDNLAKQGLCRHGELMAYIQQHAKVSTFSPDMKTWNAAQIKVAVNWAKNFEAERRNPPKPAEQTEYEEEIYEGGDEQ